MDLNLRTGNFTEEKINEFLSENDLDKKYFMILFSDVANGLEKVVYTYKHNSFSFNELKELLKKDKYTLDESKKLLSLLSLDNNFINGLFYKVNEDDKKKSKVENFYLTVYLLQKKLLNPLEINMLKKGL